MSEQNKTPLEDNVHTFMRLADKSRIAVVVPLFGYWSDSESQQLNEDTLKLTLDRVNSMAHHLLFIFVGEGKKIPKGVMNILAGKSKGGHSHAVNVDGGATYGEYLRAGIDFALKDTNAQYIVCINPWLIIQHHSLDAIVDRLNREDVKIVSGFDLKGSIDAMQLDTTVFTTPTEQLAIDTNFFGMKRSTAEMVAFDLNYKTHYFIGRDAWQTVKVKGFEAIISQRVPMFVFDMNWTEFETQEDFEKDNQYFQRKWRFGLDDVKYGK